MILLGKVFFKRKITEQSNFVVVYKTEVTKLNEMYNRIEELCKQKGINMTKMCKDAGIPRGNLSDLKHGRTAALSTKSLGKISEYFGVPMERLLGTEEINLELFAANLSRHMENNLKTPETLAADTGISIETINEMIAGNRCPQKDEIAKLTKHLFVEKEDLTEAWTGKYTGEGDYTLEEVDFDIYDLVGKYKSLSPAQKKITRQLIETFIWGAPGKWDY